MHSYPTCKRPHPQTHLYTRTHSHHEAAYWTISTLSQHRLFPECSLKGSLTQFINRDQTQGPPCGERGQRFWPLVLGAWLDVGVDLTSFRNICKAMQQKPLKLESVFVLLHHEMINMELLMFPQPFLDGDSFSITDESCDGNLGEWFIIKKLNGKEGKWRHWTRGDEEKVELQKVIRGRVRNHGWSSLCRSTAVRPVAEPNSMMAFKIWVKF